MAERIIYLTKEELEKCREFSEKSALQQQKIEYGESKTKPRSKAEIAHDNLIGKIAEVAFSKMMKEDRNIDIDLDFEYYPRGKWDSQDAEYNGWKIDVKGTRIGRWMLIEWNKLAFRQKDDELSHLYVMFSVDWKDGDPTPSGKVVYRGFATLARLSKEFPKKARSENEIARDNLIGKIAEVAFSKMMKENYGIDVPLDFNYYPRGQWDNQDAEINGWRIDVKGTRSGGRWMLIEWNKLNFRQRDNNLSHLFVMFTVDWDRNSDQPTGKVSYRGAVSLAKLKDGIPTTVVLRKGSILPGTKTHLQADNFGIQFKDLYKHLNHLVEYLRAAPPPSSLTDHFRNPYTGETTLEILGSTAVKEESVTAKADLEKQESRVVKLFAWIKSLFQ
jgi:hypothetical protein